MSSVTPEEVLTYTKPTTKFLCPLSANTYNLDFLEFSIRNLDTNQLVFQVQKSPGPVQVPPGMSPDLVRQITYTLPYSFIDINLIGTKLLFSVGNQEVHNFRLIERHYCDDTLIKSYDFTFPFCIPNTTNTWETEYDIPVVSPEIRAKLIANSQSNVKGNQSDSFFFVNNQLVMHNKAYYKYVPDNMVKLPIKLN